MLRKCIQLKVSFDFAEVIELCSKTGYEEKTEQNKLDSTVNLVKVMQLRKVETVEELLEFKGLSKKTEENKKDDKDEGGGTKMKW